MPAAREADASRIGALEDEVESLHTEVAQLRAQLEEVRRKLGMEKSRASPSAGVLQDFDVGVFAAGPGHPTAASPFIPRNGGPMAKKQMAFQRAARKRRAAQQARAAAKSARSERGAAPAPKPAAAPES